MPQNIDLPFEQYEGEHLNQTVLTHIAIAYAETDDTGEQGGSKRESL